MGLVVDTLALIDQGIRGKDRLGAEIRIAAREADYYAHAARILSLIEGRLDRATVTEAGTELLNTVDPAARNLLLVRAIRNSLVFSRLMSVLRPEEFSIDSISEFLRTNTTLTGTTLRRRANTLMAWSKPALQFDPENLTERATAAAETAAASYAAYHGGGEGDLHRRLKEAVAEDPETYLGEPMALVQLEFPFPTNDRADIVLEDSEGHLVAVEVEVDVGPTDTPGLLQAAKYRIMLAILLRLPEDAVRGVLVARNLDPAMRQRADRYGIETFDFPDFE